ncbi:MAG TPA: GMC family oxidoreductase [Candidatus Baltobacteraceae bacterium]
MALQTINSDVVVVGGGVAGLSIAYELAQTGASVTVLESGPSVDRGDAVERFRNAIAKVPECAYPDVPYAPRPSSLDPHAYYVQNGPDAFAATYERRVGGTTWHWLGTALRLLPNDFKMRTAYGVGIDWPIAYSDLAQWYDRAESELGVSGDAHANLGGAPRSGPYPLPPIAQSYLDGRVAVAASKIGLEVASTPQARNSQVYDGRPPCCGNASCIPVCPIGAKYDGSVHAQKARAKGVRILEQSVAYAIDVASGGKIAAVRFKRPDGSSHTATGKVFVVAAHAIETPKLLLASRSNALPNGVANASGLVGRNLSDHPTRLSWALAKDPVYPYRGPLSTSGIEMLRDGAFRSKRSAFRIEIGNDGWSWPFGWPTDSAKALIDRGLAGAALQRALDERMQREIRFASLNEQMPDSQNRIVPDWDKLDAIGIPRPKITYRVDRYALDGMAEAQRTHDRLFDALGVTERHHSPAFQSAGHIMGTYRMGDDPKTSVADGYGRSHDHPNLYLAGSGLFPTFGTANPTLTIAALALRTASVIRRSLGRSV